MATATVRKELAHRSNNGVNVSLFWDSVGDTLLLEVYDSATDDYFEVEVPRDRGLHAFHHPYVYRARALETFSEPVAA